MSNNWIEQMSQQMEHHEVEAPKGLWEGIEQGMEARKRGRRAKLVWAWRAGAAAAVVAGVVVGVQVWNAPGEGGGALVAQTERAKTVAPAREAAGSASAERTEAAAQQRVALAHKGVVPSHEGVVPTRTGESLPHDGVKPVRQSTVTQESLVAEASTPETVSPVPVAEAPAAEVTVVQTPPPAAPKNEAPLLAETHTEETEDVYVVSVPHEQEGGGVVTQTKHTKRASGRAERRISLQLMAMATGDLSEDYDGSYLGDVSFGQKSPSDSVRMESQRRVKPVGPARSYRRVDTAPLYGEHDFPVKVGLTLRVPLSRRFALDAGLSYARLRSELTFFTPAGQQENGGVQQVNYLGVPVALTANLWQNRWWSIYASAGGEVAKSVKTTWRTAKGKAFDVAERPWQWGVSAAVGVQFNVTHHVGLYAQPSADYYFDNHSSVKTYYTDHPFTPALRMGVRVKL